VRRLPRPGAVLLSGAFDDPKFDMAQPPDRAGGHHLRELSLHHAAWKAPSKGTIGNGNYTIEEPVHYPFAQRAHELAARSS
jgi:hypothetical protein